MNGHPGELLSAFVDGELDAARRAEVEAHIAVCAECRSEADRIRAISLAAAQYDDLDDVTTARFVAENRKRRASTSASGAASSKAARRDSHVPGAMGMALALAAIMVICVSIFVALGGPMRNMFSSAVGTGTMGQNQAALSGGIY